LGPWEIGLILILMVFLFGPSRIPEIGKGIGEALTSFKKATKSVEEETKQALPSGDE